MKEKVGIGKKINYSKINMMLKYQKNKSIILHKTYHQKMLKKFINN